MKTIWRVSANANSFGLRSYWVYDAASGDCHSFATPKLYTKGQTLTTAQLEGVELWCREAHVPAHNRAKFEAKFIKCLKNN